MHIYTIIIKIWLTQTSVNFKVQFEIKISRASKNYCEKKISFRIFFPIRISILSRKTKGKRRKAQRAVFGPRRYFNFHLPENVNHSEIPKQPQLNPLPR